MIITILGGTGTLGTELTKQLLEQKDVREIRIFSRGEHGQLKHRQQFENWQSTIKYYIGDICDPDSLICAMDNADIVYHTAALKHIDVCESNPYQSTRINITGTQNVVIAAKYLNVKKVVYCTTDKAIEPITVYGMCKAIAEKLIETQLTEISWQIFRWGNVLGSQGSVLHLFKEKLLRKEKIPITDFEMTRFWINIEDAVKFMIGISMSNTFNNRSGYYFPYMHAAKVTDIVIALAEYLGADKPEFEKISIRGIEKIHEKLYPGELHSGNTEHYTKKQLIEMIKNVYER